jgi:hypothetical protein
MMLCYIIIAQLVGALLPSGCIAFLLGVFPMGVLHSQWVCSPLDLQPPKISRQQDYNNTSYIVLPLCLQSLDNNASFSRPGDILAIAVGKGFVHTAGADGSLRSWRVDKASGALHESAAIENAHGEGHRVYQLLVHKCSLYSCASDGSVKRWTQGDLALEDEVTGDGIGTCGGGRCLERAIEGGKRSQVGEEEARWERPG